MSEWVLIDVGEVTDANEGRSRVVAWLTARGLDADAVSKDIRINQHHTRLGYHVYTFEIRQDGLDS